MLVGMRMHDDYNTSKAATKHRVNCYVFICFQLVFSIFCVTIECICIFSNI